MSRVRWDWSPVTRPQQGSCLLCPTRNIPKRPKISPIKISSPNKISSHNKISSLLTKTSLMKLIINSDPWLQVSHCRGWNWTVLILTNVKGLINKTIIKIIKIIKIAIIYSFARMDKNKMSINIKRIMLAKIMQMRNSKTYAVSKVVEIKLDSTSLLKTLFNWWGWSTRLVTPNKIPKI